MTRTLMVLLLASGLALSGQQPPPTAQGDQPLPRFRAGASLVRVDAYVSANGVAVTDLTADDFEVLEDDTPQKIENVELIRARDTTEARASAPTPSSTQEQRLAAQDPDARLFVLYLDRWHVGLDGSFRSAAAVQAFLDKVVGPNDLIGVMTPDITPQNMTLVRKGAGIDRALKDVWYWGERDRLNSSDPREENIRTCYPDVGSTAGIAKEMIERRREQQTLRSIDGLVRYLDGLREERKFVLLFSEGWVQFRRSDQLGRPLGPETPGGIDSAGVGPDGRLTTSVKQAQEGNVTFDACERERVMLSYIDHELEVRQMAQRANRANVSFYPLDPRGLVVFDDPIGGPFKPSPILEDRARLANRQDGLKVLAEQTDGAWILNTGDTAGALTRILADTNSYYLLSYYSTNPKLDGRFRRITVKVQRPDVEVRARPGYLAPTEAEARAAGATLAGVPSGPRALPPGVSRALDAIAPGRGNVPLRVQATGLATRIRAFAELDATTARQPDWQMGGTVQVSIESEKGGPPIVTSVPLPAGQRSIVFEGPETDLAPGRYYVRLEGRPERGTTTVRASTDATVGVAGASISPALVALRRGPATGLAYQATADPRFRRTERLRAEVPILASGPVQGSGRVLTREGQPLPLQVNLSERTDERAGTRYLVGDVVLAPLAQGDYVLEVQVGRESATYGFRIIP
jgi:VWFA-related protein